MAQALALNVLALVALFTVTPSLVRGLFWLVQ